MSAFTTRILKAALATAALAAAATCASAAQFKLNLPMQVQWGRAVLPAGEYLISTSQNPTQMHVFGNGKNVYVLVASTQYGPVSSNHVNIVDVNGTPVIKEFTSTISDATYSFIVPSASNVHGSVRRTVAFTLDNQPPKH